MTRGNSFLLINFGCISKKFLQCYTVQHILHTADINQTKTSWVQTTGEITEKAYEQKENYWGFPGGPVVENLSSKEGESG